MRSLMLSSWVCQILITNWVLLCNKSCLDHLWGNLRFLCMHMVVNPQSSGVPTNKIGSAQYVWNFFKVFDIQYFFIKGGHTYKLNLPFLNRGQDLKTGNVASQLQWDSCIRITYRTAFITRTGFSIFVVFPLNFHVKLEYR